MTEEESSNCCISCLRWFNNIIWSSNDDILQFDFLKPAPCVQHMFLVVLRVFVSISMLILATYAIISTADEIGFEYLSMWTMVQTTILFAIMAAVQVKN